MDLKLNKGKALDISYWSFLKCHILAYLGLIGILFGVGFAIGILVAIAGV